MRRRIAAIATLAAALAAAGCGVGPGRGTTDVSLTVTRDFGRRSLLELDQPQVSGADTMMRVLQRNAPQVRTRYGGGFVQSVGGVAGGTKGGRPSDWFFYVNGILSPRGAGDRDLHVGDRIWWDYRDHGVTQNIPAVVGSFPEPFRHGDNGRRLPVRIECTDPQGPACDKVSERLIALGVPAGRSELSSSAADDSLRVVVGPWPKVRGREAEADQLDRGPARSGVYARFAAGGRALTVMDERGRPARRLGAGTGLVAATRLEGRRPVWFVTGTDDAGVAAAADALDEATLGDHYALAIAGDRPVNVPLSGG